MMTTNTALEQDISLENMLGYGKAIREVATIFESMHDREYDFLIVPSRGASPIVDMCRLNWTSRREPWDNRGGMQRVMESFFANPLSKALHLPFTADAGNLPLGVEPRDVRRFWCGVVAGMIRDPDTDPFFAFTSTSDSTFVGSRVSPRRPVCMTLSDVRQDGASRSWTRRFQEGPFARLWTALRKQG